MYKLNKNKIKFSLFILILGLAANYFICSFLAAHSLVLALPMLFIGGITFYLIVNLILYAKASTNFVLLLSVANLLLFLILLFIPYFIYAKAFSVDASLIIEVNYIAATLAYSFSAGITKISIDSQAQTEQNIQKIISPESDTPENNAPQAINPTVEMPEPTVPNEMAAASSSETRQEEVIEVNSSEPDNNIEHNEEPSAESIYGSVDSEIEEEADVFLEDESSSLLGETPSASLDELPEIQLDENQIRQNEEVNYPPSTPPKAAPSTSSDGVKVYEFEDYSDEDNEGEAEGLKISGNIRVVEVQENEEEAQGSIASIAKLLVNQRDVENVIQINEIMQQIGCDTGNTKVVSMNKGIEIYESFNKLKVDYPQIKDMAIVEQNGFIIASYFENKRKEQTCCALGSGIYLIVQNYLAQLNLSPERIFFVFDDQTISINNLNDQVFYMSFSNTLNILEFNQSEIFLNKQNITESDYTSLQQTDGINRAILTHSNKTVVSIYNEDNIKKYTSVSNAIYDNLRVFLMNILKGTLKHIILSCDNETLVISKKEQQLLILGYAPDSTVKVSNKINEIENLISKD